MNKFPLVELDSTTIQIIDGDRGINYPKKTEFSEQGYCLFLDSSNLTKNGFDFSSKTFVSKAVDQRMGKGRLQRGDLVMNTRGTIGNLGLYSDDIPYEPIRLNSGMVIIRGGEDYDTRFLYLFLRSDLFFSQTKNLMSGSVQKQLPISVIKYVKLPKVDRKYQQKIAAVLSALDAKIELNQRINAELEQMAKTLYDYWFVQFDFPNAKGRPYKSSGGPMVWNEELKREIPQGWEVGSLLDIADYTNGLACQNFRPTGDKFLRVIKIKEMHEGFSADTELVRPDIPSKAIIENGDVLFSWSASLEVQIWSGGKGALNQHIFKVTSEKYSKSFYYYQLVNYLQHFKMMAENRKTTMGHITQEHLEQSRVVLPPLEFTHSLEKIIAPIFKKKIANEIENHTLAELRDWLLPMLMNGQVTVN